MTEKFVVQSNIESLKVVEEKIFHYCMLMNVGNYHSTISVAVLQAVENAIVHGNGNDEKKHVQVRCGLCRGGMYVEVEDEGDGFDYTHYGQLPSEGEKGEGIFVMRSLCDNMEYMDGGRRVRMEFKVEGIDPAQSMERVAVLRSYYSVLHNSVVRG